MKSIPLPVGMVVHKKIHHGRCHYKTKSFIGYVRSVSDDFNIQVNVHQNKEIHLVFATVFLDYTFSCGGCHKVGHSPWNSVMVMN